MTFSIVRSVTPTDEKHGDHGSVPGLGFSLRESQHDEDHHQKNYYHHHHQNGGKTREEEERAKESEERKEKSRLDFSCSLCNLPTFILSIDF